MRPFYLVFHCKSGNGDSNPNFSIVKYCDLVWWIGKGGGGRTSASWDDFLLDIVGLFVESRIEDVGDIIDDINIIFIEETSSLVARAHSNPQPLDHSDIIMASL